MAVFTASGCNKSNHSIVYTTNKLLWLTKNSVSENGNLKYSQRLTSLAASLQYIVAGCDHVVVWKDEKLQTVLTGHSTPVLAVACLSTTASNSKERFLLCSSDSSSTIKVWERLDSLDGEFKSSDQQSSYTCLQTLDISPHHASTLCLTNLPASNKVLLFVGGTSTKIEVYLLGKVFVKVVTLDGHTDWIKDINAAQCTSKEAGFDIGDLIVASASQDRYIRIWRISNGDILSVSTNDSKKSEIQSSFERLSLGSSHQLSTKAHVIDVEERKYTFLLDAVLAGHDNWVQSINWAPKTNGRQTMELISASSDKTIIRWLPDTHSNSWVPKDRVGEVGGSTLGFYGALLADDKIYANGYGGSIHVWEKRMAGDDCTWTPIPGFSGHTKAVEDIKWDPSGTFLLSVSQDQTARILSQLKADDSEFKGGDWHEIARPQIHGYNLTCCVFIDPFTYISGGDEKVLRVFSAPSTFVQSLENLSGFKAQGYTGVLGANLPALGLSNKAVLENEGPQASLDTRLDSYTATTLTAAVATPLTRPPFEEELLTTTLWPEVEKLYGHQYELLAIATNGTYLASTSKAAKAEHATIRVWREYKEICKPIIFHTLSVCALAFSKTNLLLSAGRDRSWAIHDISQTPPKLLVACKSAHSRIIWDVSFSDDDLLFATVSRDKTIKVWRVDGTLLKTIKFECSVTCVSFAPLKKKTYLILLGFENGDIRIVYFDDNSEYTIQDLSGHSGIVKKVEWRPGTIDQFASCSEDGSTKIHQI